MGSSQQPQKQKRIPEGAGLIGSVLSLLYGLGLVFPSLMLLSFLTTI